MNVDSAERRRQLVAISVLMVVFAWAAWTSLSFPPRARIFPQLVALIALALCVMEAARLLWAARRARKRAEGKQKRHEKEADTRRVTSSLSLRARFLDVVPFIIWIGLYYLAIFLVGFPLSSFLFVAVFLVMVAEVRWLGALGAAGLVLAALLLFAWSLNVIWPSGVLPELLGIGH